MRAALLASIVAWSAAACSPGTPDGIAERAPTVVEAPDEARPDTDDIIAARRAAVGAIDASLGSDPSVEEVTAAEDGWRRLAALCAGGDALSCALLGRLDMGGLRGVVRASDAVVAARRAPLEAACEAGGAVDCFLLGRLLDDDAGQPVDGQAAFEAYVRACEGGFLPGCVREAVFYTVSVPRKEPGAAERAIELSMRACDGGFGHGCEFAAWLPGLAEQSATLLARACQASFPSACADAQINAAREHEDDPDLRRAAARALARALDHYIEGCTEGVTSECLAAAFTLGRPRFDDTEATARRAAFGRGCEQDEDAALCTLSAVSSADPDADPDAARLERACELGHAPGCRIRDTLESLPGDGRR